MKNDCLILGEYQTNCYVLRESSSAKDCLIIDAGLGAGKLIGFLKEQKLNPVAVILTHGHIDHIASVTELREHYPKILVFIHEFDAEMLAQPLHNLSAFASGAFSTEPADTLVP